MLKVCRTEGSPHTYFMLTMSLTESNGDLRFLKKFGVSAWAGSPENTEAATVLPKKLSSAEPI